MKRNYKDIVLWTFCLLFFSCSTSSTKDNFTQDTSTLINSDSVIQTSHKIKAELFFCSFDLYGLMYGNSKNIDSISKIFDKINLDTISEKDKIYLRRFQSTVNQKLHLRRKISVRLDDTTYFMFLKERDCTLFEHLSYDALINNNKVILIEAIVRDTYYFDEKAFLCDSIFLVNEQPGQTYNDKDNTPQ